MRRCVGLARSCASPLCTRTVPIPQAAHKVLEGLECVRCCVQGAGFCAYPVFPWGVPIAHAAQARPKGLGCIRRCVQGLQHVHTRLSHGVSLSPKQPTHVWRDSGVSADVCKGLDPVHT